VERGPGSSLPTNPANLGSSSRGARHTKIPPGSGIPRDEWTLEGGTFLHDALRLTTPGAAHSMLLVWDDGRFECWYINLERPLERAPVGFDYLDQELDIHFPDRT
jgi:hypothetical protein